MKSTGCLVATVCCVASRPVGVPLAEGHSPSQGVSLEKGNFVELVCTFSLIFQFF